MTALHRYNVDNNWQLVTRGAADTIVSFQNESAISFVYYTATATPPLPTETNYGICAPGQDAALYQIAAAELFYVRTPAPEFTAPVLAAPGT